MQDRVGQRRGHFVLPRGIPGPRNNFAVPLRHTREGDRFVRSLSAEPIPRTNLPQGPVRGSGLAAFLGAHPVLTATGLVTVGAASVFTGTLGATLDTTLPADAVRDAVAARNRSIVFVGMNETSTHEVQGLINATGNRNAVTYIQRAAKPDVVKLNNVEYDLATQAGREGYVARLGLSGDRAAALVKVLEDTGGNARDELGQLARVFAEAERGERYIERLVLSGHSVGSGVWGDGNGTISFSQLAKLSLVFPRAAGQVQDLALAACYTGGETRMDQYRAMFPNVKTIWAYDGSAPGSVSGAVPHLTRWERGTRGDSSDNLRRESATHTRKGENVAVWTATRGYSNGQPPRDIADVRADYARTKPIVAEFASGEQPVANPQTGPLRDHYNHIQRLLSRRDLPEAERTALQGERDLVIRLLYYQNASGLFQATHRSTIETGFRELGLDVPDFSRLSRKDALEVIARYDAALAGQANASRTASYLAEILHGGLRDMKPAYIPDAWI